MRTARTPPHPLFVLPMADDAAWPGPRAARPRRDGRRRSTARCRRPRSAPTSWPASRATGSRSPSTPGSSSSASWCAAPAYPAGCGRRPLDDLDLAVEWVRRASCTTPTSRPAATPAAHGREAIEPDDLRAPDRGRHLLVLARRGGGAGAPHRRQPAGVRRGPDRPGLHARRSSAGRGTPARRSPRCRSCFLRRRRPGLPVHRPGQPDVQRHLRGARLPPRWSTW